LLPEVRDKLLAIAADFQEFLGVDDLTVRDITISGSNAAYSYTKNSDIDLHLVVEMPADPVYQELFNAKKYQYNDEHNIKIGGADVELYVQPADQAHHSLGIYSVKNSDWISVPQRKRAQIDDACVRDKVSDLDVRIHAAIKSKDLDRISTLWDKIKAMRQGGLEQHGEFGCENIAFKLLRNRGCIAALKDAKTALQDLELSLREADRPQKKFRYGFSEDMEDPTQQPYSSADGVAPTTKSFLEATDNSNDIVNDFIQQVTTELGIDPVPEIHLHSDPKWSEHNQSFGRYDPDAHTLNVSMPNRHVMDVLRTVAHELVHCSQNQQHGQLPDDAGETGSRWENDANARAGIIMRDWANSHPEHFAHDSLEEGASGYIPKNKREAAMPQYAMALSVDIKPGQVGKEANKLALKTGRNGEPGLLMPEAQNLLREFAEFTEEQDNLFEITMSPSSLRKLSAQTGALAGMEFEMCVPGAGDNDDGDQEPDYDFDQRCRSIQDARDFFYDGDFNSRRDVENMSDRMQNDYAEWLYERIDRDFVNESEYLISEWIANNVDESEWNPDDLEGEARQEALDEFISNVDADPSNDYYQKVLDEYREENQDSYDESDWLDAEDLDLMSGVENAYSINWPHWRGTGGGEASIEDVADSFRDAVGRPILASTSYHSGRVERPSTKNLEYIVEPDSSIDVDDNNDQGLEFVSPPLPIEELLNDLNKVKAWADRTGCYTNDSTGLHINVSVPGWTGGTDQLDYVKLALLLGDEFVLDSFGRSGNTYAKSAMGKIRDTVRKSPDRAKELMDRMKSGMDQLASKVVHSRSTEKYTSINVKDGYIEFRSPGGDWLNDNFAEIDNTLRRFTVALSAAVDPEAYRQEYLKKLYKLLDVSGEKDPLSYFAKYAAGELPRAALKSFVRQAQAERKVKSGKADAEEYDKLAAIHQELGLEPPQRATSASTTVSHPEGRGRPHDPTGRYAIVARSDQAAYGRTGGPAPNYQFRFNMQNLEDQGHGRYVLQAWAARNSVNPADYIVVDTTQYADANQIPTIDIDLEPAPAPQPAGGEFTGNWLIRAEDGTVLHRFGGIGNSQADANRTAQTWAQRNPDVMRRHPGGVDVVPEMNESLREYRMPQPNQPPGMPRQKTDPTYNVDEGINEGNQLTLRDFVVTISPHALSQAYNKGVDVDMVDDILRNISTVKDRIMSLEPGRALILHNGRGTGLGVRRQQGNRLTLATVFPTSPGFTKGKHPTFRVEANNIDEGVTSAMDAEQVLQYVKKTHGADEFNIEYSITDHPEWQLVKMPLSQLNLDPDGEQQDPYNRTNWVDYDVVRDLMPNIVQVLKSTPIVVDSDGWIIDGNHRVMAAAEAGLTAVPALVPVQQDITEGESNDTAISLSKLGKFHPGADTLAEFVPERATAQYALHPDKWESTFYSLTNKDSDKLKYYGPKKISIPPGTLVGDMAIANKFYRAKTPEEQEQYAELYKASLQPYPVDVSLYRMPELLIPKQGIDENFADGKNPGRKGLSKRVGVNTKASVSSLRKTAKNSSGEKQRMAHWLANMKAGRAKAKRK
jgi:hypothetical protein